MKINTTTQATLITNLEGNVVADPEALQAVIEDYGSAIDANSPEGQYAADAGSTDAYAVTLSPVPTAYFTGMVIRFKANTANTGAATLNVNGLGAKTIKKNTLDDLGDNDIVASQIITVAYDGTNFQLIGASQNELKLHKADTVQDVGGVHGLAVEEGIWTPTLVGGTTAGSNTYSIQSGRYIRNGNLVTVWWRITLSLKDPTMAGDIYVGGLPFVTSNVNNFIFGATIGAVSNITLASGKTQLVMAAANNDSKIQILQVGSGVPLATVAAAAIADDTRIDGAMTYRIN